MIENFLINQSVGKKFKDFLNEQKFVDLKDRILHFKFKAIATNNKSELCILFVVFCVVIAAIVLLVNCVGNLNKIAEVNKLNKIVELDGLLFEIFSANSMQEMDDSKNNGEDHDTVCIYCNGYLVDSIEKKSSLDLFNRFMREFNDGLLFDFVNEYIANKYHELMVGELRAFIFDGKESEVIKFDSKLKKFDQIILFLDNINNTFGRTGLFIFLNNYSSKMRERRVDRVSEYHKLMEFRDAVLSEGNSMLKTTHRGLFENGARWIIEFYESEVDSVGNRKFGHIFDDFCKVTVESGVNAKLESADGLTLSIESKDPIVKFSGSYEYAKAGKDVNINKDIKKPSDCFCFDEVVKDIECAYNDHNGRRLFRVLRMKEIIEGSKDMKDVEKVLLDFYGYLAILESVYNDSVDFYNNSKDINNEHSDKYYNSLNEIEKLNKDLIFVEEWFKNLKTKKSANLVDRPIVEITS